MTRLSRRGLVGRTFGLGELFFLISLGTIWFLSLRAAVDSDYGWHVQNGREVLSGSAFRGKDLYSWTASGDWVVHEWLIEAAMSMVHDSLGPSANSLLAALLGTFAFFLVAVRLRLRGADWIASNL